MSEPDPAWAWDGVMANQNDTHFFWVTPMVYNWRLLTVPKRDQSCYDRWWCYEGRSAASLATAVLAAMTWDGDGNPLGWSKNGQTQEWRDLPDALAEVALVTLPLNQIQEFHNLVNQAVDIVLPG